MREPEHDEEARALEPSPDRRDDECAADRGRGRERRTGVAAAGRGERARGASAQDERGDRPRHEPADGVAQRSPRLLSPALSQRDRHLPRDAGLEGERRDGGDQGDDDERDQERVLGRLEDAGESDLEDGVQPIRGDHRSADEDTRADQGAARRVRGRRRLHLAVDWRSCLRPRRPRFQKRAAASPQRVIWGPSPSKGGFWIPEPRGVYRLVSSNTMNPVGTHACACVWH
jgi:hypothetical protein